MEVFPSGSLRDRWVKRFAAVEEAAGKWKSIGLSALQKTSLEADAAQIAANRELVSLGRKTIGQKTRDFAKLSASEKADDVGAVLKAYQSYIDELTKHLKLAERVYLDLNATVRSMPDPFQPLSRLALEKGPVLELLRAAEELDAARRIIAEREAELSELRNQEVTIHALREELAATEMRAVAGAQVAQSAAEATSELDSVLRQWQIREAAMQKDVLQLSHECRAQRLQAVHAGEQQVALRTRLDEASLQRDRETEAHFHEVETLQIALAVAERTVSQLRE